ncbi:hypothetical protein [Streptomyces sp. NPDC052496]|uniref:hypothetical protein n=1 Tax=Streptomyces sp. NPDC052496 TaxID=3154951 RepID=UPI0034407F8D
MDDQRAKADGDVVLTRIGQAVMLHRGGDREEARNRLGQLWAEVGPDGDPFQRCTLAHYLADTQDDPADELGWDLTALETAREAGTAGRGQGQGREWKEGQEREEGQERKGERVQGRERWSTARGCGSALAALLPSLHLSLAADYAALNRPAEARAELDRARRTAAALADDEYGRGVRRGIERLGDRIAGGGRGLDGGGAAGGAGRGGGADGSGGVGGADRGGGPVGSGGVGGASRGGGPTVDGDGGGDGGGGAGRDGAGGGGAGRDGDGDGGAGGD